MPRRTRMYVAGLPYHVIQRGNNREACFYTVEDYQYYIDILEQLLSRYDVNLHAYVLMTNHVHLLATPQESDAISLLTKVLGSRYAHYINKKYDRTGTLWEGRHKSSPVDSERYLLACYRYIELNPVTAGMANSPDDYRWSSYFVNAWGESSSLVSHHLEYLNLGKDKEQRCRHYRELFKEKLNEIDLHCIRQAAHYCHPLGNERFKLKIEEKIGRCVGQSMRGRPAKKI
jgi:REP-associated tyrosine transposase